METARIAALPDGSSVVAAQFAIGDVIVAPGQPGETTLATPDGGRWGIVLARFDEADQLSWAQMVGTADGDTTIGDLAASPAGGFAIAAESAGVVTVGIGATAMTAGVPAGLTGARHGWFAELSAADSPAWLCEIDLWDSWYHVQGIAGGPDGSVALSLRYGEPVQLACGTPGAARSTYALGGSWGLSLARVSVTGAVDDSYGQLDSPPFALDPSGRLVLATSSLVLYIESSDGAWYVNGTALALYGADLGNPLAAKELVRSSYTSSTVMGLAVSGDGRAVLIGSASGTIAPGQPFEQTTAGEFVMTVALPPP